MGKFHIISQFLQLFRGLNPAHNNTKPLNYMPDHDVVKLTDLQFGEFPKTQKCSDADIIFCSKGHAFGRIYDLLGNGDLYQGSLIRFGVYDHETAQCLDKP